MFSLEKKNISRIDKNQIEEKSSFDYFYLPRKPFERINFSEELSPPNIDLDQLLVSQRQHPVVQWPIVPAGKIFFLVLKAWMERVSTSKPFQGSCQDNLRQGGCDKDPHQRD